jgi:hypothetical protein
MEAFVTTVIGLVGGFILSGLFWYITVHIVAPRITFGDGISKLALADGTFRYRIRVQNVGRRAVIDATVNVNLIYPNLRGGTIPETTSTRYFNVDLRASHVFRIAGGRGNRVLTFDYASFLARMQDDRVFKFLYPVAEQRRSLTLEDMLSRTPGANIRVRVLCYDQWSGARKYFESRPYRLGDVKLGVFSGLHVTPTEQGEPA